MDNTTQEELERLSKALGIPIEDVKAALENPIILTTPKWSQS